MKLKMAKCIIDFEMDASTAELETIAFILDEIIIKSSSKRFLQMELTSDELRKIKMLKGVINAWEDKVVKLC